MSTSSTKKASKQSRSRHIRRRSVENVRPSARKERLWQLFGEIEREFDKLHQENLELHERVEQLSEKLEYLFTSKQNQQPLSIPQFRGGKRPIGSILTRKLKPSSSSKTALRASNVECQFHCQYSGHCDGVWAVGCARNGSPLVGTASADGIAMIWDVVSGQSVLQYAQHNGSVNDISFHPTNTLVCTASGDFSTHIWNYKHTDSPNELVLHGHTAPVVSCDWLCDGNQLVTGSWDHTAHLWDCETGQTIHTLQGHDQELTHLCTHHSEKLVVTCSQDETFRLWDFRAPPIHSVNVFQGHTKSVSSVAFAPNDTIVSASEDDSVKIWELRNMKSPISSIRLDCAVNRVSVSGNMLAVPLDNRHIRIYSLQGNRLAQLPRRNNQGHDRMVCCTAWLEQSTQQNLPNLFSCGFDNKVISWKITTVEQ
ncbi:WD repeat-containing protein 37-like [Dysidea avara]|uniref:WD repeat-containing protein 37-like n=1 Tax=Dysidea avara TaxID=196820 RepID=UPI00331EEB54